jgi:hypothetical protein
MLMKTNNSGQTISIAHQNTASWHYDRAFEAYDVYTHCLDDRGLHHPDFVNIVKRSQSEYHRHIRIGDSLMRLRS